MAQPSKQPPEVLRAAKRRYVQKDEVLQSWFAFGLNRDESAQRALDRSEDTDESRPLSF